MSPTAPAVQHELSDAPSYQAIGNSKYDQHNAEAQELLSIGSLAPSLDASVAGRAKAAILRIGIVMDLPEWTGALHGLNIIAPGRHGHHSARLIRHGHATRQISPHFPISRLLGGSTPVDEDETWVVRAELTVEWTRLCGVWVKAFDITELCLEWPARKEGFLAIMIPSLENELLGSCVRGVRATCCQSPGTSNSNTFKGSVQVLSLRKVCHCN
ncbi:uncharacterized protein B0I36DRAFT_350851 [Microdochium trichocladiopsis]|uniref:Uncharacterized protein n=1 Tax=Microdochium trichocladiopsis TaxID=1682393 RepID=A0A9P9BNE0_9PEZI|nr:uncharacterized protein B0I36DRAFT_350851 [Microdochium trichocladiopsis]KAH7027294.1 hypothetical protein B0I36DRAFT_350851 [Microdochium trichocladiopsis]